MATAQNTMRDDLLGLLTNTTNVTAFSANNDGIVEITGKDATRIAATTVNETIASGSSILYMWIDSNPSKLLVVIPGDVDAHDHVKFHIDGVDHQVNIPNGTYTAGTTLTQADVRALYPTATAGAVGTGNQPTTPTVTNSKARSLVVYENDPVGGGRMFAIDPANAAGIALPAFRPVQAIPATGNIVGEAVLDTTNNLSYIWDGGAWRSIVPASIITYANDSAVLNDAAAPVGTYAFSSSTGNLFVRYNNAGTPTWRQIGVRVYALEASLLSDAAGDGSIGFATDTGRVFFRVGGAWQANSFATNTEANILASTPTPGSVAVATDTGRVYLSSGTGWVGAYVHEYATEALLRAATPLDGEMAVALDTGTVFYRTGAAWLPLNSFSVPVGAVLPAVATAAAGDLFFDTTSGLVNVFDGAIWKTLSVSKLNDLTDVDLLTTAPVDGDTLIFNGTTSKWEPGKSGLVQMGAEPATADRFHGMLWWNGGRLWIWDNADVWVET